MLNISPWVQDFASPPDPLVRDTPDFVVDSRSTLLTYSSANETGLSAVLTPKKHLI